MYANLKSKVKYYNCLSEEFTCMLGVALGDTYRLFYFICTLTIKMKLLYSMGMKELS